MIYYKLQYKKWMFKVCDKYVMCDGRLSENNKTYKY